MDFRTIVDVDIKHFSLSLENKILLFGSCFVEEMGRKMVDYKFDCQVNPFGVLYNPESIRLALQCLCGQKDPLSDNFYLEQDGYWYSWLHDVTFSATSLLECKNLVEKECTKCSEKLREADTVIFTWGSNRCYKLKDTGNIVGNCHKVPSTKFEVEDLTVEQIVHDWSEMILSLLSTHPSLRILFTVSPYRYAKYGFHGSQLGKAVLLLSIDQLQKKFPENVFYFPAYEILLDELRDYRFYKEDMLHPSEQAVEYIWERFSENYFDKDTLTFMSEWKKVRTALSHRPFHPESEHYTAFLDKIVLKIERLRKKYPNLAVETELRDLKRLKQK